MRKKVFKAEVGGLGAAGGPDDPDGLSGDGSE